MSNDEIDSDDLWAQTTDIAVSPTSPFKKPRIIIGAISTVSLLIAGLIAALLLTSNDSGQQMVIATTSTDVTTTNTITPAITTADTAPTSTILTTTTVPLANSALPSNQSITVASSSGISRYFIDGTTTVSNEEWVLAFRLSDGTYIAQHVWPGYGQLGDTAIYRLGTTTTPVVVSDDPAAEWLRLHDVYIEAGATFVLYSVKSGLGFDEAQEELFSLDLSTGVTTSYDMIGGWEEGPGRLTFGSEIIVGEYFSEVFTGPFFLTLDGYSINPNDFGLAETYEDCMVCPRHFSVDPSGQHIVWAEADLVVVLDRLSGSRVAEIRLPQGTYPDIDSIELLGDLILINRYDRTTGIIGRALLMTFAGTSTVIDLPGTATFDQ